MIIWQNNKTKELYNVIKATGINTTNAQDGQSMVEYYSVDDKGLIQPFYREITEFREKFSYCGCTPEVQTK